MRSTVSPNRRAEQKMPSQPSPYAAVRRTAASPEPPMTSGIRGSGGGRMRALLREKNCPWWSTASPVASARSTSSVSSSLRPRVAGSTPAFEISLRSSPPTPTPRISRAAAIWEMVASCLAVTMGCLSPARYTPMSTLRVSLAARIDVADTRPSKPVPPWKLMWSPVVTWFRPAPAMWPRSRRRAAGSGMSRASLTATPSFGVVERRHSAATLPIIAVAMTRFWMPAVPSAIR